MPQQYLHLPEIHAILHQVNGKAMSERMRIDIHQIILPLLHNDMDLTAFDSKYRLIQWDALCGDVLRDQFNAFIIQ